jgi:hypothetical protein
MARRMQAVQLLLTSLGLLREGENENSTLYYYYIASFDLYTTQCSETLHSLGLTRRA